MSVKCKCGICNKETNGVDILGERWLLCDVCATKALNLAGQVQCHDCGELTYGVREGDNTYDMCIRCLNHRLLSQGQISLDVAAMRAAIQETYEWHSRVGRFLTVLGKLVDQNE